jgi:hypothetical protein
MKIAAKLSLICFFLAVIAGLVWGGLAWAKADTQPTPYSSYNSSAFFFPPYPSDQERMGFDKASGHDTTALNAGWYLDWGASANPAHPGGAEYVRVIALETNTGWCQAATQAGQITPSLTGTTLIEAVQAHPGALWLVGNEPDSLYGGDSIQPELYAEFYHYFVTAIKAADPTAKVSVGAIVQPSPLRLEYLDKVLNQYQAVYGQSLPADLWNIHFYILNEGPCGSWGGAVPPFSSQETGWQIPFTAAALLDLEAMENNLRAFRQWMYDRGYGDQPLIITEFGVLPPPTFPGFEDPVSAQFLSDIFDLFLTATDPVIGYAADGNRLVQMWAWFSTNFGAYGGDLFETGAGADLTVIGEAFVAQANTHYTPYVDLQLEPPVATEIIETGLISGMVGLKTISVRAYVTNRGNVTATNAQARITLTDYFAQAPLAAEDYALGDLGGRYAQAPVYVGASWDVALPAAFTVTVTTEPDQGLADANLSNNTWVQLMAWFPDLAVADLEVFPTVIDPERRQVASIITTTVINTGNWTSTEVLLGLSAQNGDGPPAPVGEAITIPPLAMGQSFVVTSSWLAPSAGLYQIRATINPEAIPGLDLNADNNEAVQNIFVARHRIYFPIVSND